MLGRQGPRRGVMCEALLSHGVPVMGMSSKRLQAKPLVETVILLRKALPTVIPFVCLLFPMRADLHSLLVWWLTEYLNSRAQHTGMACHNY